jgi:hypothetical protein
VLRVLRERGRHPGDENARHGEVKQVEHKRIRVRGAHDGQFGPASDHTSRVRKVEGQVVVGDVEGRLLRAQRRGGENSREGENAAHGHGQCPRLTNQQKTIDSS